MMTATLSYMLLCKQELLLIKQFKNHQIDKLFYIIEYRITELIKFSLFQDILKAL